MTSTLVLSALFPAIKIFLAMPRVILSSMPFNSAISNRGKFPACLTADDGSAVASSLDSAGFSATTGSEASTAALVNEINKLRVGEFTKPINIPGGVVILKLDEKADKKISLDFDSEFKKLIDYETNRQLNQFSTVYFNKLKFNTKIEQ